MLTYVLQIMTGASTIPTLVRRYSFTENDENGTPSTIRVLIRRYSLSSERDEDEAAEATVSDGELEHHRQEENHKHLEEQTLEQHIQQLHRSAEQHTTGSAATETGGDQV